MDRLTELVSQGRIKITQFQDRDLRQWVNQPEERNTERQISKPE